MKIAHVITSLHIGGAERVLCSLLEAMDRRRFEPLVITLAGGGALEREVDAMGIAVFNAGMRIGQPSFKGLRRIARILREEKPDLIQGWMCHGNLAAQFASFFVSPRPPVLWAVHNSLPSYRAEKLTTTALIYLSAALSWLPSRVIYVSEASRRQHETIGFRRGRSAVLPNGIDVERFAPSEAHRASVRAELGIPDDTFLIGLIGRFHPQKDHANFFEAARHLSKGGRPVRFLLAGDGIDSRNRTLARLVEESGVKERVHLLGRRRDMERLTAALDIGASSSTSESLSLAVSEAMSCGVPCVVTDVGDSAVLVGDTGMVVPPRDSAALARAWEQLIDSGSAAMRLMGQRARQRIIALYGKEAMICNYEQLYSRKGMN